MPQKDNILQELNELGSQLAGHQPSNTYAVPPGYFEGLIGQVMRRIKALEAVDAGEELEQLSPVLSKLSKQGPYSVPAGYFDGLAERMAAATKNDLSAKEETASLSPLLGNLKKEMPYSLPEGYFENLAGNIAAKEIATETKVISITRRSWFRYAAAAVLLGVIATFGFVLIKRNNVSPDKDSYAWVKKSIKKISTEKLDEFIQLTETEQVVAATDSKPQEVKELIKDIPEQEIQSLLEDTKILNDPGTNDASAEEIFMN